MKTVLLFLSLLAFSCQLNAQTLTVVNNTSCSIEFTSTGSSSAPAPPCNRHYFSATHTTVVAFSSVVYNFTSLTAAGPLPPGWPGTGDFTDVSISDPTTACSTPGSAAVGNACSGLSTTASYYGCCDNIHPNRITWTVTSGGITVTVDNP